MKFTKMHGCGNDYIYVEGTQLSLEPERKQRLVCALSDRHFGIGGDGVIFIHALPDAPEADFEMEMYNADGSRAEMCGNGIRCVGKYVYDHGLTDQTSLRVVSAGQVKLLQLHVQDGAACSVRVNMGKPELRTEQIPVLAGSERVIDEPITVDGKTYRMTCVSMGNPHAVIVTDDVERLPLAEIGPLFECHERFPRRINTEFVQLLSRSRIRMRVWERGTGETLACGTGCCASAAACVLNGLTDRRVTVEVRGGELLIEWDEATDQIYMTGPAVTVFEGEIDPAAFLD